MPYDYGFADATHAALVMQQHMDQISNNLANVNTAGFKRDRLIFNDLMSRQISTSHEQGPLRYSDNPLDVALGGNGFFRIMTPRGERLTRDGSFKMLSTGALVTSGGLPVLDAGGQPVMLNPLGERPVISENGTIFQGPAMIGQLGIVDVADKNTLIKEGANLFVGRDSELPPTFVPEEISVNQGYTEMPNVQVVSEMVNMINTHRSYEAYQKTLHVMQDMDNKTVSQVGRVGN
jgi:flagellar basal-body rod protein FlgG